MNPVPATILQQIGGFGFLMLTGCRYRADEISITFVLPEDLVPLKGIITVEVKLMPNDTYRMTFLNECEEKEVLTDVYWDDLQDLFENHTGVYVTMKRRN